jgi:IS5 family transposase
VHHLPDPPPPDHRASPCRPRGSTRSPRRPGNQELARQVRVAAGVEGTIRQGIAVTDLRHARYRGLAKTHLEHVFSAVALNLIRLNAWWNGHPLDRTRTTHLTRLELALAA